MADMSKCPRNSVELCSHESVVAEEQTKPLTLAKKSLTSTKSVAVVLAVCALLFVGVLAVGGLFQNSKGAEGPLARQCDFELTLPECIHEKCDWYNNWYKYILNEDECDAMKCIMGGGKWDYGITTMDGAHGILLPDGTILGEEPDWNTGVCIIGGVCVGRTCTTSYPDIPYGRCEIRDDGTCEPDGRCTPVDTTSCNGACTCDPTVPSSGF
jgi:hypothetical protein